MTLRLASGAALLALLVAGPAPATVGGPTVVEVLGWKRATRSVYVWIHTEDGVSRFGHVLRFDLASRRPDSLRVEFDGGIAEGSFDDSTLTRRLGALRSTLRPLRRAADRANAIRVQVIARDSIQIMGAWIPRERLRVPIARGFVEFEAFHGRRDVAIEWFAIPGRRERLAVIRFLGDPGESGYDVDVPVCVVPGVTGVRRIEWMRPR